MTNDTEILKRLAELEARVEKLDGKSAIKLAAKPAPVEEGVRITELALASTFVMPAQNELRQLLKFAVVRLGQMGLAPVFTGPSAEEKQADFFQKFSAAFEALGGISRATELDGKHAASFWITRAHEVLYARRNGSTPMIGPAFLAAVIAHGDILFNNPKMYPFVQEFGLRDYGMGKPATDAWRKVLAAGSAPEPIAVRSPQNLQSPSFVRAG